MKIKLGFIALFFPLLLQAQWNFIQPLSHPRPQITDLLVDQDEIIVYGDAFNNDTEWKQGLLVAKLDTTGAILQETFILDSLGDKLAVSTDWGKIIPTSDGGYAATAAAVNRASAFLIKMNQDLEVEFIREYADTVYSGNFDYKLIEVPGGYLLFGSLESSDGQEGFIRYVRENGDIEWGNHYSNTPYGTRILDLARLTDTTWVYVTVENMSPYIIGALQSGRSGIYILDLQGNLLSAWQSEPEPQIGYLRKVVPLNDGAFLTYGLSPKAIAGTTRLVQPTLARFTSGASPSWIHHFGNIRGLSALHTLWDFAPTIDGHYTGAGKITVKTGDEPSRANGWLYKFSAQGDSIWGRNFPTPFPDAYPYTGALYGIGVLSSGNLIAGGTAEDPHDHCWIVKMTNDGCMDTLFCQITSSQETPEITAPSLLRAWPNPACDLLNIAWPSTGKALDLRLTDVHGRVVRQQHLLPFSEQISLDTSHLPAGIYFVEMVQDTALIKRTKIMIGH